MKEYTYEAFISYRHAAADRALARKIQRSIEGYRIPKALQKDGKARLGKCFRDEDELPTDSSLPEMIQNALSDSRFLIVICSPRLRESRWCAAEIAQFIQMRGRENVILAMAEGEPQDSFPLQMLHETRIDENGREIEVDIEPIAADMRPESKKAYQAELARILAPIIGCGYDDLRNRMRARRNRTILAITSGVAAVSVAFGSFALFQNAQINKNYEQSLINQSEFLAKESQELYDKGYRMQAIQTALAALPENDDRPYVPRARLALENALQQNPSLSYWASNYAIEIGANSRTYVDLSEDEKSIVVCTPKSNTVFEFTIYEIGSGIAQKSFSADLSTGLIYQVTGTAYIDEILLHDTNLYVSARVGIEHRLLSIDTDSEAATPLYTTNENSQLKILPATMRALAVTTNTKNESDAMLFDLKDGKELQIWHRIYSGDSSAHEIFASKDESRLSVAFVNAKKYESHLVTLNPSNNKVYQIKVDNLINDVVVADDSVFVATEKEGKSDIACCLSRFDIASGHQEWSIKRTGEMELLMTISGQGYKRRDSVIEMAGITSDEGKNFLVSYFGRKLWAIDVKTGELSAEGEMPSFVRNVKLCDGKKPNGQIRVITVNGELYCAKASLYAISSASYLYSLAGASTNETISNARLGYSHAVLLAKSNSSDSIAIKTYRYAGDTRFGTTTDLPTDSAKEISSDKIYSSYGWITSFDGQYAINGSFKHNADKICIFDTTDFSIVSTIDFKEHFGTRYVSNVDFSNTANVTYVQAENALYSFDPVSGQELGCITSDDTLAGYCEGEESIFIMSSDRTIIEADKKTLETKNQIQLGEDISFSSTFSEMFANKNILILSAYQERANENRKVFVAIDPKTGEQVDASAEIADLTPCDSTWSYEPHLGSVGDGFFLIDDNHTLHAMDASGKEKWQTSFSYEENETVFDVPGSKMIIQRGNGTVALVDEDTGKEIAFCDTTASPIKRVRFTPDNKTMIASLGGIDAALAIFTLDEKNFGVESLVPAGVITSADANTVLIVEDDDNYLLSRQTLPKLIELGKETVKGHELTNAQKKTYLINQ